MLPAMIVDLQAEVIDNHTLSAEYNVLTLAAADIAAAARPGQFVMIRTGTALEPLLRRPFSIFQILRDDRGVASAITLMNKRIGIGTGQLYEVAPGTRLSVLGPLGTPFPVPEPTSEAWMVAGGVGLAPFATLTDALVAAGVPGRLFYGARRSDDLHFADWFEARGVAVHLATEDGSRGDTGFVTVPLERELAAHAGGPLSLYCCGPTPMMQAVADLAARHGHETWVSLEQVMGCGMGGCYSCVVPVRQPDGQSHFVRSCLEGPVFAASTLVWASLASGHH
jgi:dihydroorotate dehydrogenase electron transfer subunit